MRNRKEEHSHGLTRSARRDTDGYLCATIYAIVTRTMRDKNSPYRQSCRGTAIQWERDTSGPLDLRSLCMIRFLIHDGFHHRCGKLGLRNREDCRPVKEIDNRAIRLSTVLKNCYSWAIHKSTIDYFFLFIFVLFIFTSS